MTGVRAGVHTFVLPKTSLSDPFGASMIVCRILKCAHTCRAHAGALASQLQCCGKFENNLPGEKTKNAICRLYGRNWLRIATGAFKLSRTAFQHVLHDAKTWCFGKWPLPVCTDVSVIWRMVLWPKNLWPIGKTWQNMAKYVEMHFESLHAPVAIRNVFT